MKKILFVCLGNICRSQMAETIFRDMVNKAGRENEFFIDSAGTSSCNQGRPADRRAIAKLAQHGLSTEHKARQVEAEDFDDFDYILAMDSDNYETLMWMAGDNEKGKEKIMMFRTFDPEGNGSVPDPYYGGDEGFENVFNMCERTCKSLLEKT